MTTTPHYDLSPENLGRAIARLTVALGVDAVLAAPDQVAEFHDPYEGEGATEFQPSFVVQPASVEEVQSVLRIATELRIPVWTSSMGRNFGYGGSAPVVSGSIVLSLRRMNRVLEISEDGAYAVIEPGVRFFDLYEAIKASGAKLWMSVPDLGWGSVIGNALEHGFGSTVYGDHASAIHGMEVVLANGEVIRTGFGAASGSSDGLWHRHRRGFGPSLDSVFFQSNFGVVTKVGIWLMPQPETFISGWLAVPDEQALPVVVDALRPLVLDGTIQGLPLMMSALGTPGVQPGGSDADASYSTLPLPARYLIRYSFYDRTPIAEARSAIVREALANVPVHIDERRYAGDAGQDQIDDIDWLPAGIPNMKMIEDLKAVFGENYAHIDFSAVIPFDGASAAAHEQLIREVLAKVGLTGAFAWITNSRTLVGILMIGYDVRDRAQAETARQAARTLAARAAERGWYEYRAHPSLIPDVVKHFDFGDHSLYRTYGRIKDALDPAGILSPGNHGIWPSVAKQD
ncbi:MAG: FAD-binding oxidoreductase [Leucobacter sp.]